VLCLIIVKYETDSKTQQRDVLLVQGQCLYCFMKDNK